MVKITTLQLCFHHVFCSFFFLTFSSFLRDIFLSIPLYYFPCVFFLFTFIIFDFVNM
jgi:hypothetical protein